MIRIDDEGERLVAELAAALQACGWRMATAESCTGGLIAGCCTARPGSSAWFERGFVTYSNAAKQASLGVDGALIEQHGAVSEPVARAMAAGALAHAQAEWAVAVTGIAGPDGGSPAKPVGTVWLAWAGPDGVLEAEHVVFAGDRAAVRDGTVRHALAGLLERVRLGSPLNPLNPD